MQSVPCNKKIQCFGSTFFFANLDPGKNLHADPDPGGIRGVKGKKEFFGVFFHVSDDSEQLLKKLKRIYEKFFGSQLPETDY